MSENNDSETAPESESERTHESTESESEQSAHNPSQEPIELTQRDDGQWVDQHGRTRCGAKTRSDGSVGERCRHRPVMSLKADGRRKRCRRHGGASPRKEAVDKQYENADTGPPAMNQNSQTHGLYSERDGYYQNLNDEQQEFLEDLTHTILDRVRDARGGEPDLFDKEAAKNIAIDIHRVSHANEYFSDEGLTQLHEVVEGGHKFEKEKVNLWASEIRKYNKEILVRLDKLLDLASAGEDTDAFHISEGQSAQFESESYSITIEQASTDGDG